MDLTELADGCVAADADEVPPSAAGVLLAEHLGVGAVEPLLAAGVWYEVVAAGAFRAWLHDAGASWAVYDDVRTAVVPHAGGARYDLVVFDPERGPGDEPLVAPVDPLVFMGRAVRMGTRSAVVRHLTGLAEVTWAPHPEYAAFTVVEALERFAVEHAFAVAVVGVPGFADVGTWAPRHPADVPGYREPVVVVGARGPEASVATGADPAIATRRPDVRIYLRHAGSAVGVSRAGVPDSGDGPGRVRGAR